MKPRRRWFQFSLRTFLVLLTIGCLWLGRTAERAREQREAVQAIEALGGSVRYDWKLKDASIEEPPGPAWLRRIIGDEFFQEPVGVWFTETKRFDEKIAEEIMDWEPNLPEFIRLNPAGAYANREAAATARVNASSARIEKAIPFLQRLRRLKSVLISFEFSEKARTTLAAALPGCEVILGPPISN